MEIVRPARGSAPARYWPRRQSQSTLYRCVQEHLETWLASEATVTTTTQYLVRERSPPVAPDGLTNAPPSCPLGWYCRSTIDLISKAVSGSVTRGPLATCPSKVNAAVVLDSSRREPDRLAVGALIVATCLLAGAHTPLSRIPKL